MGNRPEFHRYISFFYLVSFFLVSLSFLFLSSLLSFFLVFLFSLFLIPALFSLGFRTSLCHSLGSRLEQSLVGGQPSCAYCLGASGGQEVAFQEREKGCPANTHSAGVQFWQPPAYARHFRFGWRDPYRCGTGRLVRHNCSRRLLNLACNTLCQRNTITLSLNVFSFVTYLRRHHFIVSCLIPLLKGTSMVWQKRTQEKYMFPYRCRTLACGGKQLRFRCVSSRPSRPSTKALNLA